MSPAIFNSIIYYVTDNMPCNINLQVNSILLYTISHMALSDDLVIFTNDDVMMPNKVYHVLF